MAVKQTDIPGGSLLAGYLPADYADSYTREIVGKRAVTPDDFLEIAFGRHPGWINWLMKLRNTLVKPLGLKTGNPDFTEKICAKNTAEVIFGMPDSHLTFHASLWCGAQCEGRQTLRITTVVTYNNWLGRVYFGSSGNPCW